MAEKSDHSPVVVRNVPGLKLAQRITLGGHTIQADEPTDHGGDGTGPGPHDLLLAALGSCTAMTLQLYAGHKKWDTGDITVVLTIRWEKVAGKTDRQAIIDRLIECERPLSHEQQSRLVEIADKCPVHKTLMGEKTINTRLTAPLEGVNARL